MAFFVVVVDLFLWKGRRWELVALEVKYLLFLCLSFFLSRRGKCVMKKSLVFCTLVFFSKIVFCFIAADTLKSKPSFFHIQDYVLFRDLLYIPK